MIPLNIFTLCSLLEKSCKGARLSFLEQSDPRFHVFINARTVNEFLLIIVFRCLRYSRTIFHKCNINRITCASARACILNDEQFPTREDLTIIRDDRTSLGRYDHCAKLLRRKRGSDAVSDAVLTLRASRRLAVNNVRLVKRKNALSHKKRHAIEAVSRYLVAIRGNLVILNEDHRVTVQGDIVIRAPIRSTHPRKKCRNCTVRGDYYEFSRISCGAARCSLRARNSLIDCCFN